MSIYQSLSLGPYLKIITSKKKGSESFKNCSNSDCSNHKNKMESSFCPKCGSKQGMGSRSIEEEAVDLDDLITEELNETLSICSHIEEKNTAYIQPNRSNPQGIKLDKNRGSYNVKEITQSQMDQELQWFGITYHKEILRLRQECGEENVTIHWGFISYYS